jgi:L-threonylcarbamoyladenylate synthase
MGCVIAYPTETLYGIGTRYDNEESLLRIYELKMRPAQKAMPVIIGSVDQLSLIAGNMNDLADRLIRAFWPGPLTLLLPARKDLSPFITSDGKIAVRMPGDSFALRLTLAAGLPITSTSANISGMPPALNAGMVAGYFADGLDLIIDGGECRRKTPSTIIDVTGDVPLLVRKGALPFSAIEAV